MLFTLICHVKIKTMKSLKTLVQVMPLDQSNQVQLSSAYMTGWIDLQIIKA